MTMIIDGTAGLTFNDSSTQTKGGLVAGGTIATGTVTTLTTTTLTFADATTQTSAGLISTSSQVAKAWVNFNGTGTVAIRASYNVSSITDNGIGDYTVNFTNAFADANYCYTLAAERTLNNNGDGPKPGVRNGGVATGSIRLLMPRQTSTSGETYDTDWTGVAVSIFR